MVVMNKANEGLHIDGVDGIVWFRVLDENSRILYLQQLGRTIYALDEDNPLPDDKRPVVIDLANNSLTVKIEKEFEDSEPIDDLEALTIIIDWINIHDGMLPNRESSNKQEQHYYALLRKIQSKYDKYLEGFDNFEDLADEDKSRIKEIIDLASEIELWDMELPPIPKTKGSKEEFDPFIVEGVLKDFVEFEDEVDNSITRNTLLKNALKIEKWCKENYGEKEIYERRLPSSIAENEEEKKLGNALCTLRKRMKQYEDQKRSNIQNEEDKEIFEIIERLDKEYGLGESLKNALKIEKWCKENHEEKEIYERRLPSSIAENDEEKKLGQALHNLRTKMRKYDGQEIANIQNEEDRNILEIIDRLDREYNSKKIKLNSAKNSRDSAKIKNDQAKELERKVSEQLKKRGQAHEEQ